MSLKEKLKNIKNKENRGKTAEQISNEIEKSFDLIKNKDKYEEQAREVEQMLEDVKTEQFEKKLTWIIYLYIFLYCVLSYFFPILIFIAIGLGIIYYIASR